MSFVKWMDSCPWWLKIIFALPGLDIIWAIYRIVKGCVKKNWLVLVAGILWIVLGWAILWIIDIVCVLIFKEIKVLA